MRTILVAMVCGMLGLAGTVQATQDKPPTLGEVRDVLTTAAQHECQERTKSAAKILRLDEKLGPIAAQGQYRSVYATCASANVGEAEMMVDMLATGRIDKHRFFQCIANLEEPTFEISEMLLMVKLYNCAH